MTIADPDRPIGTHIFTAMEQAGGDAKLRWSVVSLEGTHSHGRDAEPVKYAPPPDPLAEIKREREKRKKEQQSND